MEAYRVIQVKQSVFADNNARADQLRRELKEKGIFLVNLMSSPGAGKTTLFRILTTLMLADRGQAQVKGYAVARAYRKRRNIIG